MAENESRGIWRQLLTDAQSGERDLSGARLETAVRERIPDLLRTRFAVEELRLPEATKAVALGQLIEAARQAAAEPAEAIEIRAREHWRKLEDLLAPQSNGHRTYWQRIVQVVTGHGDTATGGRGDGATGRRDDGAKRRRAGFAVAAVAAIAIIAFIITQRNAAHRREPNVARRDRQPGSKPSPNRESNPSTKRERVKTRGSRIEDRESPRPTDQKPKPKPAIGQPPSHPAIQQPSQPTNQPTNKQIEQPPSHPATQPPDVEYVRHDRVGTFVKVMGAPTIAGIGKGEKGTRVLKPGDNVYTATRIVTGDADKAELQFSDGTTLALNFNTTLEIPGERLVVSGEKSAVAPTRPLAHSPTRPSEVRLLLGHMWSKVQKVSPENKFSVDTPVAVATVRGTEFGLKVQRATDRGSKIEDGGSQQTPNSQSPILNPRSSILEAVLTVKEGLVEFSNAHGKVETTSMTETIARPDAKPTEPKRLKSLKTFRLTGEHRVTVTTSRLTLPEAAARLVFPLGWAGLTVRDVVPDAVDPLRPREPKEPRAKQSQIRVVRVMRGSPAEAAGLRVGDVITALNGSDVRKAGEVDTAIFARVNRRVDCSVLRNGQPRIITLTTTSPMDVAPRAHLTEREAKPLHEATALLIEGKNTEARLALEALALSSKDRSRVFFASHSITRIPTTLDNAERKTQNVMRHSRALIAAAHDNLGVLYQMKDEMGKAVRHYRHAVESDPHMASYHFNLGMVLRTIGNLERAGEELETAARLSPRWMSARIWLADVYTLLDRHDEALEVADAAVKLNPQSPDAWMAKANTLLKLYRPDEARQAALEAIELEAAFPTACALLGEIYHDLRKLDEAEKWLRKAIELDLGDAAVYNILGNVLSQRGQLVEAEKMFRKAIELEPGLAVAHTNLGGVFHKRGQLGEAEKMFRKAIELDSNYDRAYFNLGVVLSQRGQLDEAENMYRKAIELDPGHARRYVNLGSVFFANRSQLDEAEKFFRKAIELDPGLALAYNNLGIVFANRGQLDEAEKMFRKAIELDQGLAVAHTNQGGVFYKRGQLGEAEKMYRKAIELNPNNPQGLNSLAWVLAERGIKLDEALSLAQRAAQLAPSNPGILDTLGWVYFKRGELIEAETWLKKAIEVYRDAPNPASVWVHLGAVYEKKGDGQAAMEAYRKALSLQPESAEAKNGLQRLERMNGGTDDGKTR